MSVIDRLIRCFAFPSTKTQQNAFWFCHKSHVFHFTTLDFGLATVPQVFTMIVKEVKPMALTRGIRLYEYLGHWLIWARSQKEAQVNMQTVVDLTQSLWWIIKQQKSKLKPTQVFSRWATNTIKIQLL